MKPQRPPRNTLRTHKEYPFKDITEKIISCAIEVHSLLGPGLLENLYEEAMEHELKSRGIVYKREKELEIKYKGNPIGNYRLDYLIENKVIVELQCWGNKGYSYCSSVDLSESRESKSWTVDQF